jgi:hypothetical protein
VDPSELRQRAVELEADLWRDHPEDRRGAAELLAGLADYDPALLRRALLGEAGSGSAGRDLLANAIECAEDETGGVQTGYRRAPQTNEPPNRGVRS